MAAIKLRHQRYWAKVHVPQAMQKHHGGRKQLERNLLTSDRKRAEVEAAAWEAMLRLEWQEKSGATDTDPRALRQLYADLRQRAAAGEFHIELGEKDDPVEAGIEHELDKMAERVGERELEPSESIRVAALQDAFRDVRGQRVKPRRELEPGFEEVAGDFMEQWRTQRSLKETNTEQQKGATFKLFGGFWNDKPLRGIQQTDAAAFHDALRRTDPLWARSPAAKKMTWADIQRAFGGKAQGLSDATMNRHMATLKTLWAWAARRGHCSGHNPFDGFHRKLRVGVNVDGYVAWEKDELTHLFAKPPKRMDLREIIVAGMFTGMRLDELASLTWGQIRTAEGVTFLQVIDAKTPAGNRQVPLHPALSWLAERKPDDAKPDGRVWAGFNPEGPGKKAGADAGKEFSRFKAGRGFTERRKAFHSFRKNVTRQMERGGVPENEWAQVLGHEKGFTYGRYNPDGITLARKAEIIGLIDYPGLEFPALG